MNPFGKVLKRSVALSRHPDKPRHPNGQFKSTASDTKPEPVPPVALPSKTRGSSNIATGQTAGKRG